MSALKQAREEMKLFFLSALNEAAQETVKIQEFYTQSEAMQLSQQIVGDMYQGIKERENIVALLSFKELPADELADLKAEISTAARQTMMTHFADSYAALTGGN